MNARAHKFIDFELRFLREYFFMVAGGERGELGGGIIERGGGVAGGDLIGLVALVCGAIYLVDLFIERFVWCCHRQVMGAEPGNEVFYFVERSAADGPFIEGSSSDLVAVYFYQRGERFDVF